MPSNAQKTPLAISLNNFAATRTENRIVRLGKTWPCSVVSVTGAIVTVKFEMQAPNGLPIVQMPLFGPEYIRYPIQPGDKGMAITADAYLGGMSGLGTGVADDSQRANLSALMFMPFGNTGWQAVDPQAVTIYGPNGVVLRDRDSNCVFTLTPSGITITVGGKTWRWTASGMTVDGSITATGEVTTQLNGGISLSAHQHQNSGGTGDGGPPVPGT